MKNLRDLLEHEVKDLYSAETQLISALPKMAKAASNADLKNAFETHLEETKQHQQRLEQVAERMDFKVKGQTCEAMKGLIKEGESMIKEKADADVKDAGLIGAAQRVEHYEIAAYGTAHQFAQMLGEKEVAQLLEKTLKEEKGADEKLNKIAMNKVNEKAKANAS